MVDIEVMRATAARARREAIEDTSPEGLQRARAAAPLDVGRSRQVVVPVELQASLHKRSCDCTAPGCDCGDGFHEDDTDSAGMFSRSSDLGLWHHLTGVASLTETPYQMWDLFGPYTEKVRANAFSASLARNPDVAFLVNHTGLTMARTINGSLKLTEPLNVDAWLNPTRNDVTDLMAAIRDGDINQMSFAAMLEEGVWNDDYTEFTMTRLDLHCGDVSAVNYGANPYTSISSRAQRVMDEMDRLPSGAARAAMRHLQGRFATNSDGGTGTGAAATRQAPTPPETTTEPVEVPMGRSINLVRTVLLVDE